jgi:NADH dehydrogenase
MILVAGGTGTLGSRLVRRLVALGLPVRVLARNPSRAADLAAAGIEVMAGDVRDRRSVDGAFAGVDTVVSAIQGFAGGGGVSPASVDRDGNVTLIDAAAAVGASVVLVSVVGAAADSAMELFRAKYDAEQYLMRSGVAYTIVRATAFVETWAMMIGEPLKKNGVTMVFGRGDNAINFVSAHDVAALLERAVTDRTLRGRIIEIGGPDNVTFNRMAALVQLAAGRTGRVRHIPRAMLRTMAIAARPLNAELARKARAGVVMDTEDMTFDARPGRSEFAGLPETDVKTALDRYFSSC